MPLIACDSFDHYTTLAQKGWTPSTDSSIGGSAGRNGTAGLNFSGSSGGQNITKIFPASATSFVLGFALNMSAGARTLINLQDASGNTHLTFNTRADGKVDITRAGTILATSTRAPFGTGYHYFEIKSTIDDTVGALALAIDGVLEFSLTSIDTRNAGTASIGRMVISIAGSFQSFTMDDLYFLDQSGAAPNDFLGDVRVQALLPNGNGNYSQFVGSDGNSTDNYLLVDETPPNDDTDYVESATVGNKDTYAVGDLSSLTGTVHAVVTYVRARKTDAGARTITTVARSGGTDEDGSTQALSTSFAYLSDIRPTKPGGGAWTISDVNAAEFGMKVVS